MTVKLGIVMDPIGRIKIEKDSSFAMLLAAQARGWTLYYMELDDLFLRDGKAYARMQDLTVQDNLKDWYRFDSERIWPLSELQVILMRKDPPFNMEYIYATYVLELAEATGILVINNPRSLRDANEKLFTAWFPQCCPPSLVTRKAERIKQFLDEHADLILKPLDGMGGASIFRVCRGDPNTNEVSVMYE